MTIKELAIGNWVYYKDKRKPMKIRGLAMNGLSLEVDGKKYICEKDDVQPILLSEEILEKNGLDKRTIWIWAKDEIGFEYRVEIWGGDVIITHTKRPSNQHPYPDELILKGCAYVHQLQNALTFMGIDNDFQV